jgi:putative isomerase
MLSAGKFATYMPFPTLAADDPAFSPRTGYWRGPVWIDQAYLGIQALQNYGRQQEAGEMRARLLEHAAGLTADAPFYENYDPHTGLGLNAANFSWSAGYFLLLLLEEAGAGRSFHPE